MGLPLHGDDDYVNLLAVVIQCVRSPKKIVEVILFFDYYIRRLSWWKSKLIIVDYIKLKELKR